MNNILILGSEGFLGKEVTKILQKKRKKIYTFDIKHSNNTYHIRGNINKFNLLNFITENNIRYLIDLIGCSNHSFTNTNLINRCYKKNFSEKLHLVESLKKIKKKLNFFTIGSLYKFGQKRKIKKKYFCTTNKSSDLQLIFKNMFEKKIFNINNNNLKTTVINIGSVYGNQIVRKYTGMNFIDQMAYNIKNKNKNNIFLNKNKRLKNAIHIKDAAKKIIFYIKESKIKYKEINIADYLIDFSKFTFYLKKKRMASIIFKEKKFNYYYIKKKIIFEGFESIFSKIYNI